MAKTYKTFHPWYNYTSTSSGTTGTGSAGLNPNGGGTGTQIGTQSTTVKHKFKVGDRVKTIYDDLQTEEYKIKELAGVNMWSIPEYMLECVKTGNIIYQMESELAKSLPGGSKRAQGAECSSPACSCGALKTYGADASEHFHSDWCDLSKGGKK